MPVIDADAIETLAQHSWPGNVRELENLVERSLIVNGNKKDANFLILNEVINPSQNSPSNDFFPMDQPFLSFDQAIKNYIRQALIRSNGKVRGENGAAQLLKVNHNTLRSKMRKFNLPAK